MVDSCDFAGGGTLSLDILTAVLHISSPLPGPEHMLRQLGTLAPAIAWAVVIVIATFVVSRFAMVRLRGMLQRGGFALNVSILLARMLWITVWVIGLLLVISAFGIGLTPLTAFVGVVGLAASLSLQSVLQNLVAGVYLLAERPFQLGDFISVVGPAGVNHEGRVEDIQMRTTHLRNGDDELILVPNSAVFSGVVTNRTAVGGFVRHVTLTFPRDSNPQDVRDRLRLALSTLPSVLPIPEARLRVDGVGKEEWTACLTVWARTYDAASDVIWCVAQTFPEASINASTAVE